VFVDWPASRLSEGSGFPAARRPFGRALAVALALFALCVFASNGSRADGFDSLTIATASGVHAFQVEIAASEAARESGLMRRRFMPADRGMLFEFDREAPVSFWMKNTYIPLDMIFIARDGSVTRVAADAEPLSEAIIPSGGPCVAVLELNGGTAARIGLKVGDKVRHPFFKP
jgi:uncharacterized membrane protein (UPF0127 family)